LVTTSEEQFVRETMRAFRRRRVEREWEHLDVPDADRYRALWRGLEEVGITGLADEEGGATISSRTRFEFLSELGATVPALGFGLIAHFAAVALLREATQGGPAPEWLAGTAGAQFALLDCPLDPVPLARFELRSNGILMLSGAARVAMPFPDWLVLHAVDNGRHRLVALPANATGLDFTPETSSHGLRLVPFGELRCDGVEIDGARVFDWPSSGRVAREADGLLTSLIAGMVREMAERSMAYALHRYQGGKMIHEHDAVRNLVGPMLVATPSIGALAQATLEADGPGDGAASAFAIGLARQAGVDAIQVFGGYGYMEDYRVERYARDANTLETFWVQSAKRRRSIAAQRFSDLSAKEAP
jgi:alkylation response protein AidB-like acyl-CoA dehydrogenase